MPIAVAPQATGDLIPAAAGGPLPGTRLENFRLVAGGWAATIVDDVGVYTADKYLAAVPAIATKYRMNRNMITMLPDPEDETRADVFAQRHPPIREGIGWAGPESVDGPAGRALFAIYADGTPLYWPIYKAGWGVFHKAFFGSSGSGKSHAACAGLVIDHHAHYIDADGLPRGMVASGLIDHQRGQTFNAFRNELAFPAADTIEESIAMVEAFTREAWRRNGYLAHEVRWLDPKRKKDGKPVERIGRDWWDPLVDGPLLSLTIDEAHEPLSDKRFADLVTKGSRMWRKVGIEVRILSQVSLLSDLGGSTALRDMITGGFVWIGRSNNGLTGQLALNGRMNIDPRCIPVGVPGTAVILTPDDPRGMLARTGYMDDWYDALRDENDDVIGYPAVIPEETWDAFGDDFRDWCQHKRTNPLQPWVPKQRESLHVVGKREPDTKCRDIMLRVLADADRAGDGPLDMNTIHARQEKEGADYSIRAMNDALNGLAAGKTPQVSKIEGRPIRWQITDDGRAALAEQMMGAAA